MESFKRNKTKGDKKINGSLIMLRRKVKKKTRNKQKEKQTCKKSNGSSLLSHVFKPGREKLPGRLKAKKGMEGLLFKGLRSDYITREVFNEARKVRKNKNIIDNGKVLHKERPLYDGGFYGLEREKTSTESFEDLSPISGVNLTFMRDQFYSSLRTKKRNKLDLEKEFEVFRRKYEEAVGNEILSQLPKNGVLEDAISAIRKMQEQTNPKNFFEEFQQDDVHHWEDFNSSPLEPDKPATEEFINSSIFSDNLLAPITDYNNKSFTGNSLQNEILMLDDELKNYNGLLYQPIFDTDDESGNYYLFGSQGKNIDSSCKDFTITTPPIQFYRRNMF